MLVAHYIGDHSADSLDVRFGWWIIRLAQKGATKHVTHCEAILAEYENGAVDIASSSLRDGGVRTKRHVLLNPARWMITDVPSFDAQKSRAYFADHNGWPYAMFGAMATVLPGTVQAGHKFCNQSVGESVGLVEARTFTPAQFAAMCLTFGRDVTNEFFAKRAIL